MEGCLLLGCTSIQKRIQTASLLFPERGGSVFLQKHLHNAVHLGTMFQEGSVLPSRTGMAVVVGGGEDRCLSERAREELSSSWLTHKSIKHLHSGRGRVAVPARAAGTCHGCVFATTVQPPQASSLGAWLQKAAWPVRMHRPPSDGHLCSSAVVAARARRQNYRLVSGGLRFVAALNCSGMARHVVVAVCGCKAAFSAVCAYV